jgi:hypothetical protein
MLTDIKEKKIISNVSDDVCNYWVQSLTNDLKLIDSNTNFKLFYSDLFDFYLLNFERKNLNTIVDTINKIKEHNYIHFIISDFANVNEFINHLDNIDSHNFDYSILNYYSEVLFDNTPYDFKTLKNYKYFFTSTNLLTREDNTIKESNFVSQIGNRYILDYKYSLIYYYIKLGFCYFQKGEHLFENCKRQNKVFMYTKTKDVNREHQINLAIDTGKIYNKEFDQKDWYWYYNNYNNYHIPFIIDYNICKLNIINETNPVVFNDTKNESQFLTEKTLKGMMVPTPSYLLLQHDVYKELKEYGFYFLNEEFESIEIENYKNFCNFLKISDDNDINNLYQKTKFKSEQNKILLENYISSDKTKEIKLLLNK